MKKFLALLFVLTMAVVLAACGGSDEGTGEEEGTEQTEGGEETSGNNEGSTEEEGSETPSELVMGFVPSQDSDEIATTVEPLAKKLGEELGIPVTGKVMTSYNALIEAMGANTVQIGFIPAFGYVIANEQYGVEVLLKSMRYGSGTYKAQYIVRKDSGIETLEDLKGKVWAYGDTTSTSGFLFPASQLMDKFDIESVSALQNEFFSQAVTTGGHDNPAIEVLEGGADVATTFDDVRDTLVEDYPNIKEETKILAYTDEIPNDTISVTKQLDDELVQKIKDTFLSFNDDEEMIAIMNEVYNWDSIAEAADSEYDVVRSTYAKFKDMNLLGE